MAPASDILAVNVSGGDGLASFADVVAALDWIVAEPGTSAACTARIPLSTTVPSNGLPASS